MTSKIKSGKVSFDLKRFAGIKRDYSKEDVEKLKGTFNIEYTLCKTQSEKLWNLLNTEPYVNTLGSLSGLCSHLTINIGTSVPGSHPISRLRCLPSVNASSCWSVIR